jgi:hypothetical protein
MGKLGRGCRGARGDGRIGIDIRSSIAVAAMIAAVGAGGMTQGAQAATTAPAKPASSQQQARAALLPLAAIMVCSRLCPVAGVAAARIIRRAPKQIRPVRAPNPAVASAFRVAAGPSPSSVLGNALAGSARQAAIMRARGYTAHHIVAVNDQRGEFARMVLGLHAIGPNTAANGVWLNKVAHQALHTNAYYANVNAALAKYYFGVPRPTTELVNDLAHIGRLLQQGRFPL